MKLTELDPDWFTENGRIVGVLFDCPVCGKIRRSDRGHSILIMFANPPDGGPPMQPAPGNALRWNRAGETFETLTLTPSIDVRGCWHGFVTSGDVTTV